MFNSSTLPPNTPPTMSRSQKEQDAASSLVELQQSFSGNTSMHPSSGMNSPASSPTQSNPSATIAHHASPEQQPITTSPSSQQAPHPPRFELFMLPSIYRQRESAVRSTLSRSLPVFGSLVRNEDDELRRESALQSDCHLQQEQVQPPQAQYHSVYQVHRPQQASSSQPRPPQQQSSQVTRAQAFAHAHAQAYYLAHARVQTYGYPQYQQQQQQSSRSNQHQQHQQQRHKKQPQQHSQQQIAMNHHVRAVEDRRNSQPWPEPNSNKSNKPARANDPASMQNSFSIRGNGVHIQRSILHEDPQPSRQHQAVGKSSPQQQMIHQEQQRLAAGVRSREARIQQAAYSNLDQQGMSPNKMASSPVVIYRPTTDASKAYIAQQVYNRREAIQQQAYRQHQQAHEQAVYRANQQFKQQQHQYSSQQRHYPLQHHQQAMHQSKETSRQNREVMARHESLPHRQPSAQPQLQPQPQQERPIIISPSTTPETAFTTEADEDEEMYELEEDEEEDDEYFEADDDSDPDFQRASKSKRHSGSSSSGNSNHHHHGNHGSSSSSGNNNNNKKGKSVKEKPRWTAEMRESLLKAVITYKNLDDMTSFHWSQIGKQVGRSGKACKDQWRRALLPKIQQTFDRCDQDFNTAASGTSSFPVSLQPEQERNNKQ